MAHNAYIRGTIGGWATGTPVSQAEFWQMDQYIYGSINGDVGGTWAPSSPITVGGSGVTLTDAPLSLTGTSKIYLGSGGIDCTGRAWLLSDTVIGSTSANYLIIVSSSTIHGNVTINGIGKTLSVAVPSGFTDDVTIGADSSDNLTVNSTPTFNVPIAAPNGTSTINSAEIGTLVVTGSASVEGSAILGSDNGDFVTMNGRVLKTVELLTAGVTQTRDGLCAETIVITGTPGIVCDLIFTHANCVNGLEKRIKYHAGAAGVNVSDTGSGLLKALGVVGDEITIVYQDGRWY